MTMKVWLSLIEDPRERELYERFYDDHPTFQEAPAGAKKHHWWRGGLEQHSVEMCEVAQALLNKFKWKVKMSDVVQVIFLHDFPKVWSFRPVDPMLDEDVVDNQEFVYEKEVHTILTPEHELAAYLTRWGLPVSDQVWSAVIFAEGGYAQANFGYGGTNRTSDTVNLKNPLAAFIHALDMLSSQVAHHGEEL